MRLVYTLYKDSKYTLYLYLGQRNDKICLLESAFVSEEEAIKIRRKRLNDLTLEQMLPWLKENCPNAYSKAYREIATENIKILNEYAVF